MAWRVLFILSLVIVAIAVIARAWFGKRPLARHGTVSCRADAATWQAIFGESASLPPEGRIPAEVCGQALRAAALQRLKKEDPRAAATHEGGRHFIMAVPPLTLVVVIFAVIVAKLPLFGGLAVILAASALAALTGVLSVGSELRVVGAAVRDIRRRHVFARSEEEAAVAACAQAAVWMEALPPILRWI